MSFRTFHSRRQRKSAGVNKELGMEEPKPSKSSLGILNDKETNEVPGSVRLLASPLHNEPLGVHNQPSSRPSSSFATNNPSRVQLGPGQCLPKKRTADGRIILDPQPDDSLNDPLNWPIWRRDAALLSLGFYCLVGGGMTPILAAGFTDVAATYNVSIPRVALTTGLYMLGLGLGSVLSSPTAILFGKRPVYLATSVLFCASAVWCALSPNYASLLVARIVQGLSVSPCESLPSATIAEIFFLHERAYRIGIYTLLLLGGKNLVPLVSASVIEHLGWRWVFWIIALVVGVCGILLFLFVPETFWDRTSEGSPRRPSTAHQNVSPALNGTNRGSSGSTLRSSMPADDHSAVDAGSPSTDTTRNGNSDSASIHERDDPPLDATPVSYSASQCSLSPADTEQVDTSTSAGHRTCEDGSEDVERNVPGDNVPNQRPTTRRYTSYLKTQPPTSFSQTLKPWNGRLRQDRWIRVAIRPFILFAYPAVLWSTVVYSLSIGWLIVLSETVAGIYRKAPYNFTAFQTGLVYLSPFVGGVIGTAVAGKVSDIIVRFMSRRNGGVYEPEFRLVMAIPIALATSIGLMGFGWSAEEHNNWIVPTLFFGIISFGCSLGSTTAITFCVDSYRQYAGEALVTLNFSKNVFHGFVFSLFLNHWLDHDGPKKVFIAIGAIQLGFLLFTIPLYIYGKRARMWTVRKNLMGKF